MDSSWCLRISGQRLRKGGVDLGMKIALLASRRCAIRAGLRILCTGGRRRKGSEEDRAREQMSPEDRVDSIAEDNHIGGDGDRIGEGAAGSAKRQRLQGDWKRTVF